ncbi:peptide chain release factor 2 [Patescibacteria group bacterium]|nr:peptide chain release factor 2 [Patescibacteria group bacterium]MBU2036527.1 peptide chain release factor 2 [Patescibacteria group bacterium]
MPDIKKKIEEISKEFDETYKSLNIDDKKAKLKELEAKSTDPALWDDSLKARDIMQNLADLKNEIEEVEGLKENILLLKILINDGGKVEDYIEEVKKLERLLNKITFSSFLSGSYDSKNAIFSIHAGQGGTEAMDWTNMLLRMYLRFAERKNWQTKVLDSASGEEAGLKSVTFLVEGNYSYGYLKHEAGTHRLVRQSPFNADKLRQTSFALVEVLPELADIDLPDIKIKDEDLEWQFFRSSTQGGQNVQKVSTAVRVTHKPTKIVVTAQSERFQEQNRKIALNLLRSKLWAKKQEELAKTKKDLKGEYKPASWGNQIRSYVLHPYKMIKDLRTQKETSNPERFLDGEIDDFIEAQIRLL